MMDERDCDENFRIVSAGIYCKINPRWVDTLYAYPTIERKWLSRGRLYISCGSTYNFSQKFALRLCVINTLAKRERRRAICS